MKTKIELTENATMLVDANVQLPNAVKNVLGALIFASGAYTEHRKENNNWFYKDADSLIEESQVSKKTFFRAINLLETNNFIERKSGSLKKGENKVTQYKILKGVNILSNDTLQECQKQFNDTLNDTLKKPLMTHKNRELSNKNKELSNKNKEEIINIIKDNKDLINKILDKKENITYSNTKEKESYSSINENKKTKEIETMKELNEKINTVQEENTKLQEDNSKLNERLNNCAKQFKKMMQTMKEFQARLEFLENKQSSTNETSTKQEKSDLKPSIVVDCTIPHAKEEKPTESKEIASKAIVEDDAHAKEDEEKPTEGKEMPLNEKKLRYLDTMTDKQYATKQEAQKDGVNPRFLYDFKIGGCLWSYEDEDDASIDDTSTVQEKTSTIEENPSSGITTQPNEEKPTESDSEPSITIVTDNVTPKKEEKAVEKKHMYFKEVTILTDDIKNDLKKNYPISEWPKLFKIDWANNTIQSKTSRDILGYGEESKELRDMIAMDSKEGKRLMKMVGVGV